jgi:NADPH:quinone reductase-like Zn-dependent oxidoreductase
LPEAERVLLSVAADSLRPYGIRRAHLDAFVRVAGTANRELVTSLGADRVIDYTAEDFTSTGPYDIVFDTVGKSSFASARRALASDGVYLSPVLKLPLLLRMLWTSKVGRQKARFSATGLRPVPELRRLLKELTTLVESGQLRMVIDRRFPLAELAQAHAYVETGHKRGNVVAVVA